MEPMQELCQPQNINSLICGRRPRYRVPVIPQLTSQVRQQWPWLASIYRNLTYACTGTVISQGYILTAAHCVTTSAETSEVVSKRWLIVKYLGADGRSKSSLLTVVAIHPGYSGGSRPSSDVAVLKVENPILFSHHVVPACVSTEGFPETKTAATFLRMEGDLDIWETILQNHDARCRTPLNRCHTLEIEADQFCAVDIDRITFLPRGSSGGPYLVNMGTDVKERWTVAGIVSAASKVLQCKQPYTIFTKVSDFWSWIENCVHRQVCS